MDSLCPCGTGSPLVSCCKPRHLGARPAETAEALMRSRYAAYALGLGDYLVETSSRPSRPQEAQDLASWGRSVGWVDLTIVEVERGQPHDLEGVVRFVARFVEEGFLVRMEERSQFSRLEGKWRYDEGTPVLTREKLERNQLCPCGRKKKVKACHG